LIGLDHTCYLGSSPSRPNDQNGNPIPNCTDAPADVRETTMFPEGALNDTRKRSLAADDRQAVCDIYPVAVDPMSCRPPIQADGGMDATDPVVDSGSSTPDAAAEADAGTPAPTNGCS